MFRKYLSLIFFVVVVIFLSVTVGFMICLNENFVKAAYYATVGVYRDMGLRGILIGILLYPLSLASVIFLGSTVLKLKPLHVFFMIVSMHLLFTVTGLLDYILEIANGFEIIIAVPAAIIAFLYTIYVFVLN